MSSRNVKVSGRLTSPPICSVQPLSSMVGRL
jgi:hypothetical protein